MKMYDEQKEIKHIILAGDDDQAIYGWAGADVERFPKEPRRDCITKVLSCATKYTIMANKILDRIPNGRRILKTWQLRKETGTYT